VARSRALQLAAASALAAGAAGVIVAVMWPGRARIGRPRIPVHGPRPAPIPSSTPSPVTPPVATPAAAAHPQLTFPPLVERWRGFVTAYAAPLGLPVDPILRWLEIESGGDTCAVGAWYELGVFQLNLNPAESGNNSRFGATIDGLKAICAKSNRPGFTIAQLTPAEVDMEIGAGVRMVAEARDRIRATFADAGVRWPENTFDFGSAVKQIHALPAVVFELLPQIARASGPPLDWAHFRASVIAFPRAQMGAGLQPYAMAPSKHGLSSRLEDTLSNAEAVGHAWGLPLSVTRGSV
jgi:hypothetical protein